MRILTAAEILQAPDIKFEDVPTPEWGDDTGVRVRAMTAEGRAQFIATSMVAREKARAKAEEQGKSEAEQKVAADISVEATLVMLTVVDENGNQLFGEPQVEALMKKSGAPIGRIAAVAQRLAGLTVETQKATVKTSAPTKT